MLPVRFLGEPANVDQREMRSAIFHDAALPQNLVILRHPHHIAVATGRHFAFVVNVVHVEV